MCLTNLRRVGLLLTVACSPVLPATPRAPSSPPRASDCAGLLVSYEQWPEVEARDPAWSLDVRSSHGGWLLYVGADHSDDPEHSQFLAMEEAWNRQKPTLAFYEGPERPIAINRADSEHRDRFMFNALRRGVEAGHRVFAVVGRNHVPMQAAALRCAVADR